MLAAARKDLLLDRLRRDGRIVAKEMAAELGLSEDSIRRDLRELDEAGLAVRVYGGALPASPAVADYATRTTVATDSKRRIAAAAVALIPPGATVILDGGTTTLAMVDALPRTFRGTIVTHSPTVAAALLDHEAEVFLIGGRLFKHSAVSCGAAAVEAANRISADLFFLGVTGVHPTAGLTTGDADEAAMKRALASRAADSYVLASEEKIGAASRYGVLGLGEVTGIITDVGADAASARELAAAGAALVHTSG
ncbi:DeoR/GlpR family DNA-binding transcription regulator [Microbacterium sp.]|uniref:DeoR/GlpR family DNA-binding transcription regulator n=1 Tax=Microbacterium sp. TaxID=51671 RepID=UPI0009269A9A|nr:DeoR/GlpR family DNA-binding transcription regulator [uncultured Microbacterium sp.]MBN9189834.1 DeoR/GlpR transcriptional regulator [Microbacterium sp.]MBN9193980.1 DeoR/GlpR transcriptional regulator [Microbacterium sp.]OJU57111.1 MAG: DeoR family transcriptional regulator [Microbacterium sp. 70-38]